MPVLDRFYEQRISGKTKEKVLHRKRSFADSLPVQGQLSSAVEQRFCKPSVAGSIPAAGSKLLLVVRGPVRSLSPVSPRTLAIHLLCLVMLAAPWLLGAKVRVPGVIWVTCAALAVSFCLTAGSLARFRRFRPSPMVLGCVLVLLGYLVVFAWRGEPEFATAFSKEFYTDLNSGNPAGFIAPPWHERLALHASCLLTVLTVSQLGRLRTFRRRMAFCFGFSALAVVAVSLMQRWGGMGSLPWVLVEGTPERCNAGFFHYSATAACINLGWPFIIFSKWGWASWRKELGVKALLLPW